MEGTTTVTVSVIGGGQNPIPECEMENLLLGRTKVSFVSLKIGHLLLLMCDSVCPEIVFRNRCHRKRSVYKTVCFVTEWMVTVGSSAYSSAFYFVFIVFINEIGKLAEKRGFPNAKHLTKKN